MLTIDIGNGMSYPDQSRDKFMTKFGLSMVEDRYLFGGETCQDMFWRVAKKYSDNELHSKRIYDYISNHWFMPATPILSNGGLDRGLPISCFINETQDSLKGISEMFSENVWLASKGGGIGSYWGNVRSIGEKIDGAGKTSGIIPFIKVQDSMSLAISQGSLRRGSSAVYLDISHPEIEEFIDIRRPIGDVNRKSLNIHHGVVVTDDFMNAVINNEDWHLKSPLTNVTVSVVKARALWQRLLTARVEIGEPYILFHDTVNKNKPEIQKILNLDVKTSNLCSEITLPTGIDHLGNDRTAVCCLSSLNLEKFDEWSINDIFIDDIMRFLDNVLTDFIESAPQTMSKAKYSAMRERSVGLGVMGFHSYLQSKMIPFESATAKSYNIKIFEYIKKNVDTASKSLAKERGACPDAKDAGIEERFTNKTAIAPTASISNICGSVSPGIEPYAANIFVQKTLSGSFSVQNKHLIKLLESKNMNHSYIMSSIAVKSGSVQHLDFLTEHEKNVFKTAMEIDPMWYIEHAADRSDFVDQAQSLNLFLPSDISKKMLNKIHITGWKRGVKSFYYCRSVSGQRPDTVTKENRVDFCVNQDSSTEECLACQ